MWIFLWLSSYAGSTVYTSSSPYALLFSVQLQKQLLEHTPQPNSIAVPNGFSVLIVHVALMIRQDSVINSDSTVSDGDTSYFLRMSSGVRFLRSVCPVRFKRAEISSILVGRCHLIRKHAEWCSRDGLLPNGVWRNFSLEDAALAGITPVGGGGGNKRARYVVVGTRRHPSC